MTAIFHDDVDDTLKPVLVQWSLKNRGFRDYYHSTNTNSGIMQANAEEARLVRQQQQQHKHKQDSNDVEKFLLGWMGGNSAFKTPIYEKETKYQKVNIYGGSSISSSYTTNHQPLPPQQFTNKLFFLDGVMQSTWQGLEAYHEVLVHPAMTMVQSAAYASGSNKIPKRVAIIGGGEGATLREVLKHSWVETCVMIEINQELVTLAQQYLREWNDCRDITSLIQDNIVTEDINDHKDDNGNTSDNGHISCFDDDRTELYFENAATWFIERFGNDKKDQIKEEDKFDVIIMDAL